MIQYDQLYICSFEDSMINKQLNRLFTIHLLQQFLMTFGRKTISDFIHLDHAILNGNIEVDYGVNLIGHFTAGIFQFSINP